MLTDSHGQGLENDGIPVSICRAAGWMLNLEEGKLRPALLLSKLPGEYDDWLICMISSQTHQYISGFDEIIEEGSEDFRESGLKVTSVIRVGRSAGVSGEILLGAIGEISSERLNRVKRNLSNWLSEK